MRGYYEILEIPKTASTQDIKRAYFGLVKRFPPERFPEEFKELRTAYETLSDDRKRAEYDKAEVLPDGVAKLLRSAEECGRLGRHKQAAEILQSALKTYPEFAVVKEALAMSLERDGKTGAAMKLREELCQREPDNGEYAFRLAVSYKRRGWTRKSEAQYERAVMLDGGNERYWLSYVNSIRDEEIPYRVSVLCNRAISALSAHGSESVILYAYSAEACIGDDLEATSGYLADMGRVMRSRPLKSEDEAAVDVALNSVMESQNYQLFPLVRGLADLLPRVSDDLKDDLDKAGVIFDITSLEDKGFVQPFHDMLATLFNGCTCDNCKFELLMMECYMLDGLPTFRPLFNRLKKEYPQLYGMHAAFFDEALRTREPEKMISRRAKDANKLKPRRGVGMEDDENEFQPEQQTVRRESPKIGRNDPCPCGSGKKYKHCCGANA